jgi:hypothetical protein
MSLSGDQDLAERDFHSIKADDLDLPPAFRRFEERVKAHVLMCMLACYLTWHLRHAWASLTYTDETRPSGQPRRPSPRSARVPGQGLRPARCGRPPLPQLLRRPQVGGQRGMALIEPTQGVADARRHRLA